VIPLVTFISSARRPAPLRMRYTNHLDPENNKGIRNVPLAELRTGGKVCCLVTRCRWLVDCWCREEGAFHRMDVEIDAAVASDRVRASTSVVRSVVVGPRVGVVAGASAAGADVPSSARQCRRQRVRHVHSARRVLQRRWHEAAARHSLPAVGRHLAPGRYTDIKTPSA